MKARYEFGTDEEYNKYLRIYFTAIAMQGLIAGADKMIDLKQLGVQSVKAADALINELSKP